MNKTYFNYAATTPINPEVLETYKQVSEQFYQYITMNEDCTQLYNQSKIALLEILETIHHQIVYTSGGTEANNLAIKGVGLNQTDKKHFITTSYEHPSVMSSFEFLKNIGHEVTYITPNAQGVIDQEDILKEIKKNTCLIELTRVNNEIGTVNDIQSIFKMVKSNNPKIITMTDNVQGFCKLPVLDLSNVDMMTISSHKIYGPKACGALVIKPNISLVSLITGGNLEENHRGGMQSLPAQIAFVKAAKIANSELMSRIGTTNKISDEIMGLIDTLDNIKLNVIPTVGVFSIQLMIAMNGESIVTFFNKNGIEISTKSACSSKQNVRSHVLKSINLSDNEIDKTIRISISHLTNKSELDMLKKLLIQLNDM